MNVGVAYATTTQQVWVKIDVPEGSTVREAIERSGMLKRFPEIDLTKQKVGVFGKVAKLDAPLEEGARVEIYRGVTADPSVAKKHRDEE